MSINKDLLVLKIIDHWAETWRKWKGQPNDFAADMAEQTKFMEELAKLEMDPEIRHYMAISKWNMHNAKLRH